MESVSEPAEGFPPHHYITCDFCGKEPIPDRGEEWVSFGGGTWFHSLCWRSKLRGRRTWKRAAGWKWDEIRRINERYEKVKNGVNGGRNGGAGYDE